MASMLAESPVVGYVKKDHTLTQAGRVAPFADRFTTDLYLSPPRLVAEAEGGSPWNPSPLQQHHRYDGRKPDENVTPPTHYVTTPQGSPPHYPAQLPPPPDPSSRRPSTSSSSSSSTPSSSSSSSFEEVEPSQPILKETTPEQDSQIYETESVRRERESPRLRDKQLYKGAGQRPKPASPYRSPTWLCRAESERSSPMADRSSSSDSSEYESPGPRGWCAVGSAIESKQQQQHRPIDTTETLEAPPAGTHQPLPSSASSVSGRRSSGSMELSQPPKISLAARIFNSCRDRPRGGITEPGVRPEEQGDSKYPTQPSQPRSSIESRQSVSNLEASKANPAPPPQSAGMLALCCGARRGEKYRLDLPLEKPLSPVLSETTPVRKPATLLRLATSGRGVPVPTSAALVLGQALQASPKQTRFHAYAPITSRYCCGALGGPALRRCLEPLISAAPHLEALDVPPGSAKASVRVSHSIALGDNAEQLVFELASDGTVRCQLLPDGKLARQLDPGNTHYEVQLLLLNERDPVRNCCYVDKYATLAGSSGVPIKTEESFAIPARELPARLGFDTQLVMTVTALQLGDTGGLGTEVAAMYRSDDFTQSPNPVADIAVVCEDQAFNAMRGVLMSRSPVLKQLLSRKPRAIVAITGAPHNIVKNIIDYCHTDTCEILLSDDITLLIKLFETAVRFRVDALSNELAVRLISLMTVDTVQTIQTSGQKTGHLHLQEAVRRFEGILASPRSTAFVKLETAPMTGEPPQALLVQVEPPPPTTPTSESGQLLHRNPSRSSSSVSTVEVGRVM